MAVPTQLDIIDAVRYLSNRESLAYITKWRSRFPHIPIDYTIRWANSNDYYVPPTMLRKTAVVVRVSFSRRGCEAMSCFPYTETGVIDFMKSPIGGYTQTSNVSVQYNQPACFNLDTAAAARDGKVQSVELTYSPHTGQCVMVDSMTKAWFNSPYLRTSKHVVRGVDDVPGFDVVASPDPNFPEMVFGRFNEPYCRRFGRNEMYNSCTQPWYETFVSFILGESVYSTFKMTAMGAIDDLRNFDYVRPSTLLPEAPPAAGITMLEEWYRVRDGAVRPDVEKGFLNNVFPMNADDVLEYTAEQGFRFIEHGEANRRAQIMEDMLNKRAQVMRVHADRRPASHHNITTKSFERSENKSESLEQIIMDFLDDHAFIMSIITDMGFNVLESTITNMIQQLNKVLIPSLKRMLMLQSRRMTVALLGETYKAAMIHSLNKVFVSTVTSVAKATVKAVGAAASVVNLALTFLTVADLVLMIWDPFGYSAMFPSGYLNDLSSAFLAAHYESIDADSREIIELLPEHFSNFVIDENEEYFVESMLHLAEYLAELDINSNGQIVDLQVGDEVVDLDEKDILGAALASNDTWAYFRWFCARHDARLDVQFSPINRLMYGLGLVAASVSLLYYSRLWQASSSQSDLIGLLIMLLIVVCLTVAIYPSVNYYTRLMTK